MDLFSPRRLVFIGLGGIGSWLVEPIVRYFMVSGMRHAVLVDGDLIEASNLSRQSFDANFVRDYKVSSLIRTLRTKIPTVTFESHPVFVNGSNVGNYVRDHDLVIVSPDNHAARRLVSEHAKTCDTIAVFTAGNELFAGSVHVYVRLRGVELTKDFMRRHPEAVDKEGERVGCGALIDRGAVQLIAVNYLMSALVVMGVHMVFKYGTPRNADEVYVGIPQELYGSIDGQVRTSLVVHAGMVQEQEAKCSS